jgi:hypothetical protein
MLQVFLLYVAKVDLKVTYTCMLQVYVQVFRVFHTYVISVLSRCYICLQWLHTCFQVFSSVCKYSKCMLQMFHLFRRMLQVFHLDIAKVDLVLQILQWDPHVASACCSYWGAAERARSCVHARGKWRGREQSSHAVEWRPGGASPAWVQPRYHPIDRYPIGHPVLAAPIGCGSQDGNGYPKPEYPTGITR